MATYRISGVWTGTKGAITHYAIHRVTSTESNGRSNITLAEKTAKADAIRIVEGTTNTVTTMIWKSASKAWHTGEIVTVVSGSNGKYLRSNPDNSLTDNLDHLPDFSLIY
jgi:hypothetical protein